MNMASQIEKYKFVDLFYDIKEGNIVRVINENIQKCKRVNDAKKKKKS